MSTVVAAIGPYPTVDLIYAGFWRRFAGLFLDGLVLGCVSGFFTLLLGDDSSLAAVLGVLAGVAYQVYFFTGSGQTLGSKVMGVRVVGIDGNQLSVGAALARVLGAYVSGLLLGIGYLWMLWDANKQTLHDKMAGSVVVKLQSFGLQPRGVAPAVCGVFADEPTRRDGAGYS